MRLLFIIFTFLFIISCRNEKVKPFVDPSINKKEIPVQESWNSKILFTEDGNLKAVLLTDHLRKYADKRETLLDGVHIDFYDEEGNKTSTLTSKFGKVEESTRNMFAIDSVVAVSDSGVTLTTDELKWENRTRKITTDKFVTIITPDEKIEGFGFESDQSLRNYVIYNITYITDVKDQK